MKAVLALVAVIAFAHYVIEPVLVDPAIAEIERAPLSYSP